MGNIVRQVKYNLGEFTVCSREGSCQIKLLEIYEGDHLYRWIDLDENISKTMNIKRLSSWYIREYEKVLYFQSSDSILGKGFINMVHSRR